MDPRWVPLLLLGLAAALGLPACAPKPPPPPVAATSSKPLPRPQPPPAAPPAQLRPAGRNEQGYRLFLSERDGSTLVEIPGGAFQMGSDDGWEDEAPAHRVEVASFYLGREPVTLAKFRRFAEATGYRATGGWQGHAAWGEEAPVTDISWHDAVAYCRWAGLRLPTEAEWEYASRGTEGRTFPWGDRWDPDRVVWGGNSGGGAMSVAARPEGASPFGVLDLAGNVSEWCSTQYRPYPYRADDGREELEGDATRVLRGGTWVFRNEEAFRSANRDWFYPDNVCYAWGFRVARSKDVSAGSKPRPPR